MKKLLLLLVMLLSTNMVAADPVNPTPERTKVLGLLITQYGMSVSDALKWSLPISKASEERGVPYQKLVAIIAVESQFDPAAKSKANAIGAAQIKQDVWDGKLPYNIHTTEGNIMAGAHILREYKETCGNWICATAAYNIGISSYLRGDKKESAKEYLRRVDNELESFIL